MAEVKLDLDSLEALDNSFEKRLSEDGGNHLTPIVKKGEVVRAKPSLGKKFKEAFISDDMKDVGDYIFLDIVVPGIKNAILDTLERIFFNGGSYSRRGRDRRDDREYGRVSYSSYYTSRNGSKRDNRRDSKERPEKERVSDYRNIILTQREDAEEIVNTLRDRIHRYEKVSVADLLELIEEPGNYTDNNYGWFRESDICIKRVREGYLIDVPPAEYLGE